MMKIKNRAKINGVYIQSNSIRLIQAQEEGVDLKIANETEIDISPNEQGIIRGLEELKSKSAIEGRLFTVIPRSLTTVKYIDLPSDDENELKKMVKYEASQLVPYRIEEVVIDYISLKNLKGVSVDKGYTRVLAVIVPREIINRHLSFFQHIGLTPEIINLSSICLYNSFCKQYKDRKGEHLIVHISGGELDIIVVKQGELVFSRGLVFSGEQGELIKEIRESLGAYLREARKENLESIILCNKEYDRQGIFENLKREFSCSVELAEQIDIMRGLVQRETSLGINLLPETTRVERKREEIKRNFRRTFFLLVLNLSLAFSIAGTRIAKERGYLLQLIGRIDKIKEEADIVIAQRKQLQVIEESLNSKKMFLEMLASVYKITPDGILFKQLIWEANLLTVKGESSNLNKVLYFISELDKSSYLINPQIKYTTKRVEEKGEVIDFEISVQISPILQ